MEDFKVGHYEDVRAKSLERKTPKKTTGRKRVRYRIKKAVLRQGIIYLTCIVLAFGAIHHSFSDISKKFEQLGLEKKIERQVEFLDITKELGWTYCDPGESVYSTFCTYTEDGKKVFHYDEFVAYVKEYIPEEYRDEYIYAVFTTNGNMTHNNFNDSTLGYYKKACSDVLWIDFEEYFSHTVATSWIMADIDDNYIFNEQNKKNCEKATKKLKKKMN